VVFGILRGVGNVLRLPLLPLWWLGRALGRPRAKWLVVHVRSRIVEMPQPRSAFLRLIPGMARNLPTALSQIRTFVRLASGDRGVEGVVFVLPSIRAGWATTQSLRELMVELRGQGKKVVAYLPEGGGNREIFVASAADEVYLSPQATIMALGLAAEARYFKPLLDKLGVGIEAFARAEYKTAVEPFVREGMSEPQREQLDALLGAMDGALRAALASRPGMDPAAVARLFEAGFVRGQAAVDAGFADGVCYEDELPLKLGLGKRPLANASRYFAFHQARFFRRVLPEAYIGVVPISGAIGSRRRAEQVIASLRLARRDKKVRGVVLHVDSPGGSATVSDLIHREVVRLREKKPVVAYFGNVAASGGYYVAASADEIVAQPLTITGSIGVVSARLVARQLLAHLGIHTEVVRKAPHADMFSPARELEDDERAILERELDGFYDAFVDLVAAGRGRDRDEIEPLARGRVWSGVDAQSKGLVDVLGGLEAAVDRVKQRLQGASKLEPRVLSPRRPELVPPNEPPAEAAARATLAAIAPEAAAVLPMLQEERALYWAPSIPRID